jgi:hypothetical protein
MTSNSERRDYSAENLAYPVLMIGDDYFLVHKDAASLTKCTVTALERREYEKATFIDASGNELRASSVKRKSYVPPLFGLRLMTARQIYVALDFEKIRVLSLTDVAGVMRDVLGHVHSGADPEYLSDSIASATSIGDLFRRLA